MNQLLVIGNGFDLANGVKTSYSSFFESTCFQHKKEKALRWRNLFNEKGKLCGHPNLCDFDDLNCWVLLFCLESEGCLNSSKAIKWCDVERVIYDSLTNSQPDLFSWELVREVLNNRFFGRQYHKGDPPNHRLLELENSNVNIRIVAECLFQLYHWEDCCSDKNAFYKQLLLELKKFEELFGLYIKQITASNGMYYDDAWSLVNRLLGTRNDVQIDSFNYSDFSTSVTRIRHINGDCDAPIFGINLSVEEENNYPELQHFTKTSRRLHQDIEKLNRNTIWKNIQIDKAVVFGHSLNQMDYDYFYYLFTMLQFHTFDLEKMGSVEFWYKNYDHKRSEIIRSNYADSVYALLSTYERGIGAFENHILVNLLRFSGKLTIHELNE